MAGSSSIQKGILMILISHRGNRKGPKPDLENDPIYINDTIFYHGFNCEIDLWVIEKELFLGHDKPKYKVKMQEINKRKSNLYIHAKNMESVKWLIANGNFNFFFHDKDECTLTNNGEVWCYPSKNPIKFGINLMPEWNNLTKENLKGCYGVCSDYIERFK